MAVVSSKINLNTHGNADILDITEQVARAVSDSSLSDGIVTVFSPSATSALTTIEYESGALADFRRLFDEIVDPERHYEHNAMWGDGNGHSHIRAALLKPSLTIPFIAGRLTLGTWQQIIYVDFDSRPRRRELIAQVMGE